MTLTKILSRSLLHAIIAIAFSVLTVEAQTSVFTYQGKVLDGGVAANGSYDMRFRLFDGLTGGAQVGSTFTATSVQAAGGIFTVEIDFGTPPFTGPDRFLEIAVSPAGQNNFTVLAPRQRLTSTPYAVKAVAADTASNSLSFGGLTPDRFVQISPFGNVGIGAPASSIFKLHVVNDALALRVQTNFGTGTVASFGGRGSFEIDAPNIPGGRLMVTDDGDVGIGTNAPSEKLDVRGLIRANFATNGTTNLCFDGLSRIARCSSSSRYKTGIASFGSGLNLVRRLRPVSFRWKDGGMSDLGLVAEEVERVEPLLVTRNEKSEIEGVKYDRLGVVLINAVREQQTQIEGQEKEIDDQKDLNRSLKERLNGQQERLDKQQTEIEALKKLICLQNPTAELCGKNRE